MALTRPKIWDLDTNIEYFMDPITVLHQGATQANVDVGFLVNRANGLVSNVALYWNETTQSFVTAFTANTGINSSNITVQSYANITAGSITGTLTTANQPNITTLSGVTSIGASGSTTLTGTLQTASQPNITSLGTLTGLVVSGTTNTGTITASTVNAATIGNVGAVHAGATLTLATQANIAGPTYLTNNTAVTSLQILGTAARGGAGYHDFLVVTNQAATTTPTKNFRLDSNGNLQIINSNYSNNIFTLTDAGALTVPSLYVNTGIFWAGNNNVISLGGGGSAPVGNTGQVQYNSGSTLGASSLYFYSANNAVAIANTTTSTSTTTGALQILGGLGVAGALFASSFNGSGSGLTGTATSLSIGGAAPAGTLTGTTLASGVTASSLTSVGTIATGVWNGTAVTVPYGGTGLTSLTSTYIPYGNGTGALSSYSGFNFSSPTNAPANMLYSTGGMSVGTGAIAYPTQATGIGYESKGGTSNGRFMVQDGNGRLNQYWNAYTDAGGYKYIVTGEPSARYLQSINGTTGGVHAWYGAPSGTAGTALTWTQLGQMTSGTGGTVWFSPRGTSTDFSIGLSGGVSIGNATDPGATNLSVTGTVTAATLAGTLSTVTQNSVTTMTSLASVGTIATGTWSASFGAVSGANLTSLTAGNLTGTIPSGVLGNSTHYIGTTAVTLNRASASQSLTGVSIDGSAATVTGAAQTAITSVGTLTSLTVSGTASAAKLVGGTNAGPTTASNYGLQASGSYGGGLSFTDGTGGIGIYSTNSGGNLNFAFGTASGTMVSVVNISSAGVYSGKATTAQYADLAERYTSDVDYPAGTVVVFGGNKEITISTQSHDTTVAGIISTNPAYLMNSEADGLPVALTGRVPCQVQGPVSKGQVLVTSETAGVAQAIDNSQYLPGCVIGKALEAINTNTIETIEVVVGRF